jgi:BioD-like phosphotransacetylase family protein
MGKGLKIGFFKPFGKYSLQVDGIWTDNDAILFKEALGLSESVGQICPYLISDSKFEKMIDEDIGEEIEESVRALSKGKDVVLIMGSKEIYFDDISRPLPDSALIAKLNADCILIHRYQETSTTIYSILSIFSLLREKLRCIILNQAPPEVISGLKKSLIPFLIQKGIPQVTVLQDDPLLRSRSLGDIIQTLEGELICGEEGIRNPVSGMTVGNTDLMGDLILLKRVYNKIVLLGPEPRSSDPNLPRNISGIILTGGKRPAHPVIEVLKKARIPLILVKMETFSALERMESSPSQLSARDDVKVCRFIELMDEEMAFDQLFKSLGLS